MGWGPLRIAAVAALTAAAGCGADVAQRADLHVGTLAAKPTGPRARAALDRSEELMMIGRAEAALEHATRAAGHAGLTPEVVRAMARANVGLGRLGQAERLLRPLAESAPGDAAVQSEFGRVLLALDRPAEASRVLRLAFALDPEDTLARDGLSESLARLGEPGYDAGHNEAFTLGHEGGGLYVLGPPS
ncbi:tetratricopeptide repeat protein [Jannaschia sp. Os4]|uniref:tetratricopeptide repeat protein n=1 Tax=Jannaschia sp. Os4 TaxID=2807617 RepID=UPI001939EE56|nr:tetratricopeptide repeat protein [Jannaschia sp. Os4]MBM2574852.1 tetratricopeptide repeat protein [Jannaschia sp. Os4]